MKKLYGFAGKAGVGKDTAANALIEVYDAHRYAFADPIKDMLRCIGVDAAEIENKEAIIPGIGKSLRECMQTLGTEWGRHMISQDLWLFVARSRIHWILKAGGMVAVADVRYDNEAALVRDLGGKVIEIIRPGVGEVRKHESEDGISPHLIDHTIFNDSSIGAFKERVYGLV